MSEQYYWLKQKDVKMGDIYFRRGTEYIDNFEHGGIEWVEVAQRRAKEFGVELHPVYALDTDTGREWQVTPENCFVWMSDADDLMDMISLEDPDDGMNFMWFRAEIGDERFDQTAAAVGQMATRIMRLYPGKGVQDMFEERMTRDVGESDSFPDEWQ